MDGGGEGGEGGGEVLVKCSLTFKVGYYLIREELISKLEEIIIYPF